MQSLTIDMSDYQEIDAPIATKPMGYGSLGKKHKEPTYPDRIADCKAVKKKAMVEGALMGATGVVGAGLFATLVLPMVSLAIPALIGATVVAAVERGKEERAKK